MNRLPPFLLLAAALGACRDEPVPSAAPAPPLPAGDGPVVLEVSDSTPVRDQALLLTVRLRPGDTTTVGSYLARLTWDARGLEYQRDATPPGGLRALNPAPGLIRSAGAAPGGFANGVLLVLEFRVADPAAMSTLLLKLEELNGVKFESNLPRNAVSRTATLDLRAP